MNNKNLKAKKASVEALYARLVEYANINMEAVLEGVEEIDAKLFTTYLGMVRNDSVSSEVAVETKDELLDTLNSYKKDWGNPNGK